MECDPKLEFPCCSSIGWCGKTKAHCECKGCVDYRKVSSGREPSRDVQICNGAVVLVIKDIRYDSSGSAPLLVGMKGTVWRIDADGDALVDFDGVEVRQYVLHANFQDLALQAP